MSDHEVRELRIWRVREFLMMVAAVLLIATPLRLAAQDNATSSTPASGPAVALAQADASSGENVEELKAMTNQVLRSLGSITGTRPATVRARKPQATPAGGQQDYAQLMQTLSELVRKATLQGKNSQEIMALIEEALAEQDQAALDALLQQAGGKVGLRRLLTTLVQKAAMQTASDDPYVKALQAEGSATRVAEGGPEAEIGEGERTVVVRPGDTLGGIALRIYGSVGKWRAIFEANRDRLNDPDLVPVGIRLRLP